MVAQKPVTWNHWRKKAKVTGWPRFTLKRPLNGGCQRPVVSSCPCWSSLDTSNGQIGWVPVLASDIQQHYSARSPCVCEEGTRAGAGHLVGIRKDIWLYKDFAAVTSRDLRSTWLTPVHLKTPVCLCVQLCIHYQAEQLLGWLTVAYWM